MQAPYADRPGQLSGPLGQLVLDDPQSPERGQGPDREYRFLVEGEEKERVVVLEGFALTEGPDHYMDVRGWSVGTGFEWRVDLGPPELYLPSDASESVLSRVL